MHLSNTGLSYKVSSKHREEIVALGIKAFEYSTTVIETRIGTLQEIIESEKKKLERLQEQQGDGTPERIARALQFAQQAVDKATYVTSVRLPSSSLILCYELPPYHTGGKIDEPAYRKHMYPNVADRTVYAYPEDGLLQIFDAVPEHEFRQPTQRNARAPRCL